MIIAIFGFSYGGKTTFIRKHFSEYSVVFDLKTFYRERNINPNDYRGSEYDYLVTETTKEFQIKKLEAFDSGFPLIVEYVINANIDRLLF